MSLTTKLEALLRHGGNPNLYSNEDPGQRRPLLCLAIEEAARTQNFDTCHLLLNQPTLDLTLRCEPDCVSEPCRNKNALELAILHDLLGLAKLMLKKNPRLVHDEVKNGAGSSSTSDTRTTFSRRGPQSTSNKMKRVYPLHLAAFLGRHEMIALLLLYKADVDVEDRFGQTPLFFAKDAKTAKLLLKHGANPAHRNESSQTCLHLLASSGHARALETVLEEIFSGSPAIQGTTLANDVIAAERPGCTVPDERTEYECEVEEKNAEDHAGRDASSCDATLLQDQCGSGPRLLIDWQDKQGYTALHFAAGKGEEACLAVLLDHGADLQLRTRNSKKTPILFAEAHGKDEAAYYLYTRWTGSRRAPWRERLGNPLFLFAVAILVVGMYLQGSTFYDFFLDLWSDGVGNVPGSTERFGGGKVRPRLPRYPASSV